MRKTKKRNNKRRIKRNNKRRTKRNNKRHSKRNNKRRTKRNNKRRIYKGGWWGNNYNFPYNLSFEPEEYYDINNLDKDTYSEGARKKIKNLFKKFKKDITIYNFSEKIIRDLRTREKFFKFKKREKLRQELEQLRDAIYALEDKQKKIEMNFKYVEEEQEEKERKISNFFHGDDTDYVVDNKKVIRAITLMKKYNKYFIKEKINDTNDKIQYTNDKIQNTNIAIEKEEEDIEEIENSDEKWAAIAKNTINPHIKKIRAREKQKNYEKFISNFFIYYNTRTLDPNLLYKPGHRVYLLNIMRYIYNYERILLLEYIIFVLNYGDGF